MFTLELRDRIWAILVAALNIVLFHVTKYHYEDESGNSQAAASAKAAAAPKARGKSSKNGEQFGLKSLKTYKHCSLGARRSPSEYLRDEGNFFNAPRPVHAFNPQLLRMFFLFPVFSFLCTLLCC